MSDRPLPAADVRAALRGAIPTDTSAQVVADDLIPGLIADRRGVRVLDLGCGRGDSIDAFRAADPEVRWTGADLPDSEELGKRSRGDATVVTFDGTALPFGDAAFDVVFCKQVLEHVERPAELYAEVARVLVPGGVFAGSTSQLEPYHGWSTGNPTPYGVKRALERVDLELELVRPGIDGLTLIARRLARGHPRFDRYWARRSPFNRFVDGASRLLGWDAEDRNAVKLLLCGQFVFVARRPWSAEGA